MPDIEEILAALADENDDGQSEEQAVPPTQTSQMKDLRDWGKQWEKKAKELARLNRELEEFRSKALEKERLVTVSAVFKELELPEKQADLFLKAHEGEVTADAIRQFVTDYGLKDLSVETGGTTEQKSEGFEPGGGGQSSVPGPKVYSRAEWLALAKTSPDKARQLYESGRVDTSEIDQITP